jgi:hypothetical protein
VLVPDRSQRPVAVLRHEPMRLGAVARVGAARRGVTAKMAPAT